MSDTKTYVFGQDGNGGGNGYRDGFGTDFLMGAMMGNGGFGGFGGGGNWLLPFLLFALWGNNGWGNGFGNRGGLGGCCNGVGFISDQLNNEAGRDLIMQGLQCNRDAIDQLSSTLNCNVNEVRTALNAINTQICNLGSQMGMNTMQVIQAINSGNTALQAQLAECCCKTQTAILESNYLTERGFCNTNQILTKGFSDLGYATAQQTCDIEKSIESSTSRILEGQRAAEMRALTDKIDALREKNAQQAVILNNAQQTSQFAAMLAPIQADLAELKCNQLPVKKIACPETYVPVNNAINATYGLIPTCGYGFGNFGLNGWSGWNNGCCGSNSLWG